MAMSTFHCLPNINAVAVEHADPATLSYSLEYSGRELRLHGSAPANGYGLASEAILCTTAVFLVLKCRRSLSTKRKHVQRSCNGPVR